MNRRLAWIRWASDFEKYLVRPPAAQVDIKPLIGPGPSSVPTPSYIAHPAYFAYAPANAGACLARVARGTGSAPRERLTMEKHRCTIRFKLNGRSAVAEIAT